MAKQKDLYLTKDYKQAGATFTSTDSTTIKTIYTAGSDDSRITMIAIASSSASDSDVLYYLNTGSTDFLIGHVDVLASSGFNGTVNQTNGLNRTNLPALELNASGMPFYPLAKGNTLRAAMKTALTSGTVTITITSEEF